MATLLLWVLVLVFVGAFAVQVRTRVRLIAGAPNTFSTDPLDVRLRRFLVDVVGQRKTIAERPVAGLAHAFVFWGFVAFGGYTAIEFLAGLGIVDLTGRRAFGWYRLALVPFALAVLVGGLIFDLQRLQLRSHAIHLLLQSDDQLVLFGNSERRWIQRPIHSILESEYRSNVKRFRSTPADLPAPATNGQVGGG